MKTLREIGEFGLISQIKKWSQASRADVVRGMGDDAAVVGMGKKALLITTDILIEDIHFERSWTDPFGLGKKALAVNLSDIAAMGGVPKYFLISIGLPKDLSFSFVSRFYRGLKDQARRFGVDLIGGDTSLSQKIIVNICLIGEGKTGKLLFRNGAKPGEDLYVSGTLGDSALGLRMLQKQGRKGKPNRLTRKHHSPLPRIELGQAIANHRFATAMIDVSDGLLIDAGHLLEESGVGVRIWESRIPLSRDYQKWIHHYSKYPFEMALRGGEDYELLFTASPHSRKRISSLALSLKIPITRIGEVLAKKEGFSLIRADGREVSPHRLGFDHFK